MISWGLRCFPSQGERSAVVVLAGLSPEEREETGRLLLTAEQAEDLRGRLADRDAPRGSVQPAQEGGKP